jgi:hypothetical protein
MSKLDLDSLVLPPLSLIGCLARTITLFEFNPRSKQLRRVEVTLQIAQDLG